MSTEFNFGDIKKQAPPMGKQDAPKIDEKAVMSMIKKAISSHEDGSRRDAINMKKWVEAEIKNQQEVLKEKGRKVVMEAWVPLRASLLGRYGAKYPEGNKHRQKNSLALVKILDEMLESCFGSTVEGTNFK